MSERQTIKLKGRPTEAQVAWLEKHVGPRTHWLPLSVGGRGWRAQWKGTLNSSWELQIEKEEYLSFFVLYWT